MTSLGIRSNFINENGISYLFEKLVLPAQSGPRKQNLTEVYLKSNEISEYFIISLAKQVKSLNVKVFVDDFTTTDYLDIDNDKLDK